MKNTQKLESLISEINKLIETSNEKTEKINSDIDDIVISKMGLMFNDLSEAQQIISKLGKENIIMGINIFNECGKRYSLNIYHRCVMVFANGINYFTFDTHKDFKTQYLESTSDNKAYRITMIQFINSWSESNFEEEFIKYVSRIIEDKAKVANKDLENTEKMYNELAM